METQGSKKANLSELNIRYLLCSAYRMMVKKRSISLYLKLMKPLIVGYASKQAPAEEDPVFEVVENMPEFAGGMGGLMQYLSKNIKYPVEAQKAGIQGRYNNASHH